MRDVVIVIAVLGQVRTAVAQGLRDRVPAVLRLEGAVRARVEAVWVTGLGVIGVGVVALLVIVMVMEVVLGAGLSYSSAAAIGGSFSVKVTPLLTIFVRVDAAIAVVAGFELSVRADSARLVVVDLLQLVRLWSFLHV